MRTLLAIAAAVWGSAACAPETSLTRDTFLVDPTRPDACIVLTRDRLRFVAAVGESETLPVVVRSDCEGLLELREITFDAGNGPFRLEEPRDLTLGPGVEATLLVTFTPPVEGQWSDRVFIDTNDPNNPREEVIVNGETP